jgi:hypothetical protein
MLILALAYAGAILIALPYMLRDSYFPGTVLTQCGVLCIVGSIVWYFSSRLERSLTSGLSSLKTFSEFGITEARTWHSEDWEDILSRSLRVDIVLGQSARSAMLWLDLLNGLQRRPRLRLLIPDIHSPALQRMILSPEATSDFRYLYEAVQERALRFGEDVQVRTTEFQSNSFVISDRFVAVSLAPPLDSRMGTAMISGETYGPFGDAYRQLFETMWERGQKLSSPTTQS